MIHFTSAHSPHSLYYIIIVSMLAPRQAPPPSHPATNPISRINRGFRKGKFYQPPPTPATPHPPHPAATTALPLRFSSLSRNKENHPLSDNRPSRPQHLQLEGVARKLQFEAIPRSSSGSSLSFTEIIRKSREKRESLERLGRVSRKGSSGEKERKKAEAKVAKVGTSFGKLKNRLIGPIPPKLTPHPTSTVEQEEMVRISTDWSAQPS